jgi:hypothetical protein
VDKVALGQVFLRVLRFSPASIIPPLLRIHLSPPYEVCYSSDQAAHYHHFGPKLGASFLTWNFGWKHDKKESYVSPVLRDYTAQYRRRMSPSFCKFSIL